MTSMTDTRHSRVGALVSSISVPKSRKRALSTLLARREAERSIARSTFRAKSDCIRTSCSTRCPRSSRLRRAAQRRVCGVRTH
eukprot:scaffold202_cov224-Pavlova_lutheri.AAC.1